MKELISMSLEELQLALKKAEAEDWVLRKENLNGQDLSGLWQSAYHRRKFWRKILPEL